MRPGLARGVRLVHDPVRDADALLYPEGSLVLDGPAADIVRACDGRRDAAAIAASLLPMYEGVAVEDVTDLLVDLAARRLMTDRGSPTRVAPGAGKPGPHPHLAVGLVAELTYRCPLRCSYCSNPLEIGAQAAELTTAEWVDVLEQARDLGVLQVHFSGGEPLLRRDLPELAAHAQRLGMYTNLITSGLGLTEARLTGVDHVQLSIQDSDAGPADEIAGVRAYGKKLKAAAAVRTAGLPLTVNVVLHARNVDRLAEIADLAVGLGAERLELAHTQFYGWGLLNREALMPTPEQIARANTAAVSVHSRYGERLEIVYVEPDYHTGRPKPCMNGWGSRQFSVTPTGEMLPCLAASQLPGPPAPSVRSASLAGIWLDSELFNRFRGTEWMAAPCRDCALRELDHGGCRCQAFALTGDPAATDPACSLSPRHSSLAAIASAAGESPRPALIPRRYR
ncbi:pyrroloquinoline quinone biosynthesis protein PqqE [Actinoplanes sp. NPDC051411]|uniref:pyrroloquinoline quinone biosynthesis protein PqqE n=1 Tax=Actinoplanes sp. NPDC051411 TaxID=3155522 RepID=UPI00343385D9